MKYIVLYAYIEKNLGDDLFIEFITNRYSKKTFYVLNSHKCDYLLHNSNNIKIINIENNFFISRISKIYASLIPNLKDLIENHSTAVVYIGGSIFIEYENWRDILNWWEYQSKNHNFYVLGSNFGPYTSEEYRERFNLIFKNCKDVCLRDKYSYKLFENNNMVRYAPDILLAYKMPKLKVKKQIFISVINCEVRTKGITALNRYHNQYVKFLLNVVKQFIKHDYKVIISSFCKREGDEEIVDYIFSSINDKNNLFILNYNGFNSDEILKSISSSSYIIASRFHATILSLAANRPVLPVIYSDKTRNILKDMAYPGIVIDIRDLKDKYTFDEICKNMYVDYNINPYIKKAEEHFLILDKNLK